jgi:hypothetical protein
VIDFQVSAHAVRKYRERVLGCPERIRPGWMLIRCIQDQIEKNRMMRLQGALVVAWGPLRPKKKKPHELTVNYPTHMFVIEEGTVVTTLGFMMMPKKSIKMKRIRRRAMKHVRDRLAFGE